MVREYRLWLNRQPGTKVGREQQPLKRKTQNYYLIALRAFPPFIDWGGDPSLTTGPRGRIEITSLLRDGRVLRRPGGFGCDARVGNTLVDSPRTGDGGTVTAAGALPESVGARRDRHNAPASESGRKPDDRRARPSFLFLLSLPPARAERRFSHCCWVRRLIEK